MYMCVCVGACCCCFFSFELFILLPEMKQSSAALPGVLNKEENQAKSCEVNENEIKMQMDEAVKIKELQRILPQDTFSDSKPFSLCTFVVFTSPRY